MKRCLNHASKIFVVKLFFMIAYVLLSVVFGWLVQYHAGQVAYAAILSVCYWTVAMSEGWLLADSYCHDGLTPPKLGGLQLGIVVAVVYAVGAVAWSLAGLLPALRVWAAPFCHISDILLEAPWVYLGALPDVAVIALGYWLGTRGINFKERFLNLFKYGKSEL